MDQTNDFDDLEIMIEHEPYDKPVILDFNVPVVGLKQDRNKIDADQNK